ncbi:alpha/beta hydrolase-fold protein [Aquimarina gracilis]|uniref:Alpha/beta hydrolase-fold protein n=1 Tax=Aquimarina gracilis TaxID=874422 RepID=A0ABU5ZUR6_9FLAO|nr:alpha/beta hydrolase-fold protein [Aquimarina gracilis]MEB3345127.1 alpha/beta hydrolase-fold protein [Aquimarina gracilis]
MEKKIFIALLTCFVLYSAYTQTEKANNYVGQNIVIKSKVLGEKREIQIFLPTTYTESNSKYPVLFVLHGQRYFLHAVSLQKSFVGFRQTPEFIVVGITKTQSERNRNFSSNSKKFLNFIEHEVIEFVDSNYRASQKRLLFGWAYAGGFTVQSMIKEPDLFDAYIAASPFPVSEKIAAIDSLLTKHPDFDKSLYFSSDLSEGAVVEGTVTLNKLLTNKAPSSMSWEYRELNGEEHRSTPYSTLYHGITNYFRYYPELQFSTIEEFKNSGGLDYVYDYYKKRSSQFGFPTDLSDWTMFSLIRNAIRANDFKYFETFINEFQKTGVIERLRVNRSCLIAEFYLKNKQYNNAIELFSLLAEKHPNSERPLYGLSDTYKELQQNQKAEKFYEKANALSKKNSN